jgi:hypothetical protein
MDIKRQFVILPLNMCILIFEYQWSFYNQILHKEGKHESITIVGCL